MHGKPKARQEWAVQQLKYAAASNNLGLNAHATLVDLYLAVFPSLATTTSWFS
jgi:hypothetical protein